MNDENLLIQNNSIKTIIFNFINSNWIILKEYYIKNKILMLQYLISIFIHLFIMICFEIYFYFTFIVKIEKTEFINKILEYMKEINNESKYNNIINIIINKSTNINNVLYENYINSQKLQRQLLNELIIFSLKILGFVGIILLMLITSGLFNYKKINWLIIIIENILMLLFLGLFEYIFFINVILNYNPLTNDELKYIIFTKLITNINQTKT